MHLHVGRLHALGLRIGEAKHGVALLHEWIGLREIDELQTIDDAVIDPHLPIGLDLYAPSAHPDGTLAALDQEP